ncbi:MAG: ankyrin repeat domain-containing protein [Acidobacteriota bacterium]
MKPVLDAILRDDAPFVARKLDLDPRLAKKPQLLQTAARFARPRCLALLLDRGADPNATFRGYRPLHSLIQEKPHGSSTIPARDRVRCTDLLLARGADPAQLSAFPPARALLIAAFSGEMDFVARLLAIAPDGDVYARAALGDSARVRAHLLKDAGLARARDAGGLTALQCAAASRAGVESPATARKLLEVARLLLDAGADPNARTRSWSHEVDVAYFAASTRNAPMLRLLLERGADATAALPSAAWNDTALAAITLEHGARIDRATDGGKPLLNQLVRWGQIAPALWLVAQGASPDRPDDRGWTAVHQAASRGNARMLAALLDAGGDAAKKDREGKTPVDVARAGGKQAMLAVFARSSARAGR